MNLLKTNILKICILFLLFFSLIGCPYYPNKINFYEKKKYEDELLIYNETNDFYISIRGDSYFNSETSLSPN